MARECAEQGGQRVPLSQHMRQLWDSVGYATNSGEGGVNDNDDAEYEGDTQQTLSVTAPVPHIVSGSSVVLQADTPAAQSGQVDSGQEGRQVQP